MRKLGWRHIVATGALFMSLGMAMPMTSVQAEEVNVPEQIVEIEADGAISPYADEIVYIYRTHNGRRQRRRWNRTQGEWVDKKWQDLGPA